MANFTALKTAINNAIKTNGNEEITGAILQAILDAMVETLGDSAINDLENAITTEVTNRENAVGDVAANLAAEALARANKDNQLDGRINQEEYNRQNADAALSQTMNQGFQTLGSQMTALNAAISALNAAYQNGYLYGGIATPSSSPSNNKCFYIALQGGTYTNFGGVGVVEGINIIKNDSGWKVEHIYDQTTLLNEFYLLRQQVIRALASYEPIVVYGDVTNAPDEEDLTSNAQHLLKFKDRDYSPLNFSGMGMKILRKNILPLNDSVAFNGFLEGVIAEETLAGTPELIFWDRMNTRFVGIKDGVYYADWSNSDNYVPASTSLVYMYQGTPYRWDGSDFSVDETEVPNLVNCLTQDMINEANTIYIIRYDYTLKEDITIPANCALQFDGGSISGEHTITGTDTIINAKEIVIFGAGVIMSGTWHNKQVYTKWFSSEILHNTFAIAEKAVVYFSGESYSITKQLLIPSCVIIGNDSTIEISSFDAEELTKIFLISNLHRDSESALADNIIIDNLKFKCSVAGTWYIASFQNTINTKITRCSFFNNYGGETYSYEQHLLDFRGKNTLTEVSYCYFENLKPLYAGGCIWVRSVAGDIDTVNIHDNICKDKGQDESISVYNGEGLTFAIKDVTVQNNQINLLKTNNIGYATNLGIVFKGNYINGKNVIINNVFNVEEITNAVVKIASGVKCNNNIFNVEKNDRGGSGYIYVINGTGVNTECINNTIFVEDGDASQNTNLFVIGGISIVCNNYIVNKSSKTTIFIAIETIESNTIKIDNGYLIRASSSSMYNNTIHINFAATFLINMFDRRDSFIMFSNTFILNNVTATLFNIWAMNYTVTTDNKNRVLGGTLNASYFYDAGSTTSRPTTGLFVGRDYFDTTINKPIWYKGSDTWVDATGATV